MTLVSIEGLDGAGKSTVIKELEKLAPGAVVFREPGGTDLGEVIRAVLKGEESAPAKINLSLRGEEFFNFILTTPLSDWARECLKGEALPINLSPEGEVILFNWSRAELIGSKIIPALESGQVVILDRFYDSTIAYQGFGRGLDINWVNQVILKATRGLAPDLTFYLKISPETRHQRMKNRPGQDRIEASGDSFFQRVADGFNTLSSEKRFVIIDAEQSRQSVLNQVREPFLEIVKSR